MSAEALVPLEFFAARQMPMSRCSFDMSAFSNPHLRLHCSSAWMTWDETLLLIGQQRGTNLSRSRVSSCLPPFDVRTSLLSWPVMQASWIPSSPQVAPMRSTPDWLEAGFPSPWNSQSATRSGLL